MVRKKIISAEVSGSPIFGEPEYLVVGYLRRSHGLRGEMIMEIYTDFPERLKPSTEVYIGDSRQKLVISGTRYHQEGIIIKFQGLDTPERAAAYRNQHVYVKSADRPVLPKGQFYHHELIGFDVVTESGEPIGRLSEIVQTGANDVYVVRRADGKEILLPVIASVIIAIDVEIRKINIRPIPGLLDDLGD